MSRSPSIRAPSKQSRFVPWLLLMASALIATGSRGDELPGSNGGTQPGGDEGGLPLPLSCPAYDETALPTDLPVSDAPSATALPGAFSVSATGEATYTIPLVVPPGRAGMEPRLAVTYNSAGGPTELGMGFALQGFSAVTRCGSTIAQDGFIRRVGYNALDRFCLDGARLVEVASTQDLQGNSTREYRTLPDRFSKVIAHYPAGWDTDLGPEHVDVLTKGGHKILYGSSPNSRVLAREGVVAAWWITREEDRRGNAITYAYESEHHPTLGYTVEHRPHSIAYTSHPNAPASRSVFFEYFDSAIHATYYSGGMKRTRSKLLWKVHMLGPNDAAIRDYVFTYTGGEGTARPVLTAVTECAGDTCKPPTRFGWSSHPWQFTDVPTSLPVPPIPAYNAQGVIHPRGFELADVTGDGLPEIILSEADPNSYWRWRVAPNEGAGMPFSNAHQAALVDFAMPPDAATKWAGVPLDYDMDGRTDFLLEVAEDDAPTWQVLRANEDAKFDVVDTGIPRLHQLGLTSSLVVDMNGDGAADLVECLDQGGDGIHWTVRFWSPDGPGWEAAQRPIPVLDGRACWLADLVSHELIKLVDVDSDGKVDLLVPEKGGYEPDGAVACKSAGCTYYAVSYEGDTFTIRDTNLPLPSWNDAASVRFPDLNGDGLPDAVMTGVFDREPWSYMNSGDGFLPGKPALPVQVQGADKWAAFAQIMDADGDGNMDLLVPMEGNGLCPPGLACWVVLHADPYGLGTFSFAGTGIFLTFDAVPNQGAVPCGLRVADVDGDGRQDIVWEDTNTFTIWKNDGPQDLLVSVTDGQNLLDPGDPGFLPNVSITYDTLVDRAAALGVDKTTALGEAQTYDPRWDAGNGCAYPRACAVGPHRVVSKYVLNNGANQARTMRMRYRDGRFHHEGRGFLGFGARITIDADTGAGSAELYDNVTFDPTLQVFPFAHHVVRSWSWVPGLPSDPHPERVALGYTSSVLQMIPTAPATYATLAVITHQQEEQGAYPVPGKTLFQYVRDTATSPAAVLSERWSIVSNYDTFGNILADKQLVEGVDLQTSTGRKYDNDSATWTIGQLTHQETCSTALGRTQCRAQDLTYNAFGEVTLAIAGDPADPATEVTSTLSHDGFGNVTHAMAHDTFGQHRAMCVSYEPEGIFPFAQKNGLGHTTFTRFDPGLGVFAAAVDPNGLATRWRHDAFGAVVEERRPDGTKTLTSVTRSKDGGPQSDQWAVRVNVQEGGGAETLSEYAMGRLVRTQERAPTALACDAWTCNAGNWFIRDLEYDDLGRLARQSQPWLWGNGHGAERWDAYEHDARGHVVKHTTPWNRVVTYDYDGNQSRATDSSGVVLLELDKAGRVAAVTDQQGNVTETTYGPWSAVWSVARVGQGQVEITTTERDAYGRVLEETDPNRGATTVGYDGFGQTRTMLDALGRSSAFTYDVLGRQVQRDDDDHSTTTWEYDTAAHAIGRLAQVTSPAGHVKAYSFDALSRPITSTLTIAGTGFTTAIGYDVFSRVETITYPHDDGEDPLVVRRSYDPHGFLLSVADATTNAVYWQLNTVDAAGRMTLETFGNGVSTAREYFAESGRTKRILTKHSGTALQDLRYTYDDRLNLASRTDGLQPGIFEPMTELFQHDSLDRLTCTTFTNGLAWNPGDDKLGTQESHDCVHPIRYAPNGNIAHKWDVGDYTYDPAQPHAVRKIARTDGGEDGFDYDAVGNQVLRPDAKVAYTAFDLPASYTRLSDGSKIRFDYDGDQQRIRKVTPDEIVVYVGGLYERIKNADGVTHRHHVATGGASVLVTRTGGEESVHYLHEDVLGSIDVITDASGNVLERRSYDAFGARRNPAWGQPIAPAQTPGTLGFTGHEEDELGLVNMRGRIYDPKRARFLQTDPIVSAPHLAEGWNGYSYVRNSPLRWVDPSGFDPAPLYTGPVIDNSFDASGNQYVTFGDDGIQAQAPVQSGITIEPPAFGPPALPQDAPRDDVPVTAGSDVGKVGVPSLPDLTRDHELMRPEALRESVPIFSFFMPVPSQYVRPYQSPPNGAPSGFSNIRQMNGQPSVGVANFSREVAPGTSAVNLTVHTVGVISAAVGACAAVGHLDFALEQEALAAERLAQAAEEAHSPARFERYRVELAAEEIVNAPRRGSGLKPDSTHRAASYLTREQLKNGRVFSITGRDGHQRVLLQVQGEMNGRPGIFEYILDLDGAVTHQRFIAGGDITGVENQHPK